MSGRSRTDADLEGVLPASSQRSSRTEETHDPLRREVDELLEEWTRADRHLFDELLEDAGTELQREMLLRVVAARHTPAEAHAFADDIRAMSDQRIFDLCTVSLSAPNVPVTHRLRAEADPLFAMELNGHRLSPRLEDDPGPAYDMGGTGPRPRFKPPPALMIQPPPPRVGPAPRVFEEESSTARGRPLDSRRELGASGAQVPSRTKLSDEANARPATGGASTSLINEAVKALGLVYREHLVDTGELTLERALEHAAQALARGVPVPVTLGRKAGELGRQALMLQLSVSGKVRVFQLHDPFSHETVWAHERDLLGRAELPFDSRAWRRITAVALPVNAAREPPSGRKSR